MPIYNKGDGMKIIYGILLCISFFLSHSTMARWANIKDASVRYDLWRLTIQVEKDGSYTQHKEIKATVLKNSAIHAFGNFALTYNGSSQKIQVLSAKTINNGKEFPVDLNFIEDKPLASSFKGFDQTRQILIAFPHVQSGSKIYIRYRLHVKTAPYKNFFSFSKIFGWDFMTNVDIKIKSALPLSYKINNPNRSLKISYRTHKAGKKKYEFKIKTKRPIFKKILDEKYVFLNYDLFPWVEVSTTKKWSKMVQHLLPKYQEKITEPLPQIYQDIAQSAKKIKTGPKDQIDLILASLIEKVRYMGDWRPINGGYIPRSLSTIVKTGFGDCKDLSISLVAILKALGFKAQVALVNRSSARHNSNEFKLPSASAFNHAIVRAEINNKVFWLDATNDMAYSRGLFSDIVDRPALILRSPKAKLMRIPKAQSAESEYHILQNFEITKQSLVKVTGDIHFKGRSAIGFTGASLNQSKKSIDYQFIQFTGASDISTLKQWKVDGYDLSSRIVKDFSVKLSYIMEKNSTLFGYRTQFGPVFLFPRPYDLNLFYIRAQDRISDLFLSQPRRMLFTSKMKNIKPIGKLKFNCHLKSKWLDISRQMLSLDPLVIRDIYEFKQPQISIKELKSKKFSQLQKDIRSCITQFLMIYKTH